MPCLERRRVSASEVASLVISFGHKTRALPRAKSRSAAGAVLQGVPTAVYVSRTRMFLVGLGISGQKPHQIYVRMNTHYYLYKSDIQHSGSWYRTSLLWMTTNARSAFTFGCMWQICDICKQTVDHPVPWIRELPVLDGFGVLWCMLLVDSHMWYQPAASTQYHGSACWSVQWLHWTTQMNGHSVHMLTWFIYRSRRGDTMSCKVHVDVAGCTGPSHGRSTLNLDVWKCRRVLGCPNCKRDHPTEQCPKQTFLTLRQTPNGIISAILPM